MPTNAAGNTGQARSSTPFSLDAWERRFPMTVDIPLKRQKDMWFLQAHLQDEQPGR